MKADYATLDENQREIVHDDSRVVCVQAGPGSGKTRVLTAKMIRWMSQGENWGDILCVTFTRKAAGEIGSRVRSEMQSWMVDNVDVNRPVINTIHGVAMDLICGHWGDSLGYGIGTVVMDEFETDELIRHVVHDYSMGGKRKGPTLKGVQRWMTFLYQGDTCDVEASQKANAVVAREVMKIMRNGRMVPYDRMVSTADRILCESEFPGFEKILVDECQDNSADQWNFIRALMSLRKFRNLFVVGDPHQSIYEWRGAKPGLFVDFARESGVSYHAMKTNYRSYGDIYSAAVMMIDKDTVSRNQSDSCPRGNPRLSPAVSIQPGHAHKEACDLAVRLIETGSTAILARTNREVDQCARIMEGSGFKFFSASTRDASGDIRKNRLLCRQVALLKWAEGGCFNNAMTRMALDWCLNIQPSTEELTNQKDPLAVNILNMNPSGSVKRKFVDAWMKTGGRRWPSMKREGWTEGMPEPLLTIYEAFQNSWGSGLNLVEFVRWYESVDLDADECGTNMDHVVRISTIHKAKGLEWDHVIIPEFRFQTNVYSEDSRLAYVAITRARNHICVMCDENPPESLEAWMKAEGTRKSDI
jgi:superfamily I DNA/RNA helicase